MIHSWQSLFLVSIFAMAAAAEDKTPQTSSKEPFPPVKIDREPLKLQAGAPISSLALVSHPPAIPGVRSWTLETAMHRGEFWTMGFSPDGRRLATGGHDGVIRVWDVETGRFLRALLGHSSWVNGVAWSPDGNTLASASSDATVRLWDVESGYPLRTFRGHESYVVHVAWSPDGKMLLASGGISGWLRFWQVVEGKELHMQQTSHGKVVYSVAWSPDGKSVACGCQELGATIWDVYSGSQRTKLGADNDTVFSVAWSPDGTILAAGGGTQTSLWDVAAEKRLRTFAGQGYYVQWLPGSKMVASAPLSRSVSLWDADSAKLIKTIPAVSYPMIRSPDGKYLACGNRRTLSLWETESGKLARSIDVATPYPLILSPGRALAAGVNGKTVRLWETNTGKLKHTLEGHSAPNGPVEWSANSKMLATGSDDKSVKIWDASSGKLLQTLNGHSDPISALAWSGDGKLLASGSNDKTVRIWDVAAGKSGHSLSGHVKEITAVAWSPRGGFLASGSADRSTRIWNTKTGQAGRTLQSPTPVSSLAWSPDGRLLAVGLQDTMVQIWNPTTGQLASTIDKTGYMAVSLAWSPDGSLLATGSRVSASSDFFTVRIWQAATGRRLQDFFALSAVKDLSWSRDGGTLAASCADQSVRIWRKTGQLQSVLTAGDEQLVTLTAEGHYRGPAEPAPELVYVVQTDRSQETLPPSEFAAKHRWKNAAGRVPAIGK